MGAQVDWSLFLTKFAWLGTIDHFGGLLIDFWLEDEIDTGSLGKWVREVLVEVILEVVLMILLAVWTAERLHFEEVFVSFTWLVKMEEWTFLGTTFGFQILELIDGVGVAIEVNVLGGKAASLLDLLFCPLDVGRMVGVLSFGKFLLAWVRIGPREHRSGVGVRSSSISRRTSHVFFFAYGSSGNTDVVHASLNFHFSLLLGGVEIRIVLWRDNHHLFRISSTIILAIWIAFWVKVSRHWIKAVAGHGLRLWLRVVEATE